MRAERAVRARCARNRWQCQSWVAKGPVAPLIAGSANPEWREPVRRQKSLAAPELGGRRQISLAVPMPSGEKAARARNPWQCQSLVAKGPVASLIPGSANPERRELARRQKSLAVPTLSGVGAARRQYPRARILAPCLTALMRNRHPSRISTVRPAMGKSRIYAYAPNTSNSPLG